MTDSRPHPNYENLCQTLGRTDPAEIHGLLCGLLCVDHNLARDRWRQQLVQESATVILQNQLLGRLFDNTQRQLNDDSFEFIILLPEDDTDLTDRVDALGHWCQGFLAGLGLAGIADTTSLGAETEEFLHDISHIANVGLSVDDADEDDEHAYVEIIEYLRIGVLLVHQELQRIHRPQGFNVNKLH